MASNSSEPQKNSKVSSKPQDTYQDLSYISQCGVNTQVSKPDEKRNPEVSELAYTNEMVTLPKKQK